MVERASLGNEKVQARVDLHPSEADGKDVGFGPMPYFLVDDLDATLSGLAGKGVKVGAVNQQGRYRFATIWDSEGNAIGLEEGC